jgi:PLD-like domain
MTILQGAALGLKLRELSDNAKQRVWIVSPYIGRWPAVSALLGANWWLSNTVLLRVITDIDDPTNVNRGTLIQLLDRGPVATLRGVHAKIYVVDDQAIVSSANLTETAFTKRREIGILLDATEAKDVITIVNTWWDKFATEISPDTVERWQNASSFTPEAEGEGLPPLWGLPQKPPDSLFKSSRKDARDFASYRNFLKCYNELAQEYTIVQRLWPNGALFIETDTFLNYLFHEAEGTPAFEFYDRHDPRTLTKAQRSEELAKWAPRFAAWVRTSHDETYRFQRCQLIRTLLAKDRLDDLSRDEIRQVVDCLHCMHSPQLIRHKFLNPANN